MPNHLRRVSPENGAGNGPAELSLNCHSPESLLSWEVQFPSQSPRSRTDISLSGRPSTFSPRGNLRRGLRDRLAGGLVRSRTSPKFSSLPPISAVSTPLSLASFLPSGLARSTPPHSGTGASCRLLSSGSRTDGSVSSPTALSRSISWNYLQAGTSLVVYFLLTPVIVGHPGRRRVRNLGAAEYPALLSPLSGLRSSQRTGQVRRRVRPAARLEDRQWSRRHEHEPPLTRRCRGPDPEWSHRLVGGSTSVSCPSRTDCRAAAGHGVTGSRSVDRVSRLCSRGNPRGPATVSIS